LVTWAERLKAIPHHHKRFDLSGHSDALWRRRYSAASQLICISDTFDGRGRAPVQGGVTFR
jgi:hypothetical protein